VEKGEKMNIIFALASMLIIYPLIFILPLRISSKHKLILMIVALLISMVGILSENLIPIWQRLLLMVALASLVSIFVTKRMPELEVIDSIKHDEILQNTKLYTTETLNNEVLNIQKLNQHIEPVEEIIMEESISRHDIKPIVSDNTARTEEQTEISVEEPLEPLLEELNYDLFVAATLESLEEEIDYEEFEKKEEAIELKVKDQLESSQYLSEIEKLLQEEEFESLLEKEEKVNPIVRVQNEPSQIKEIKLEKLY
jgi:hypothetical protein